MFPKEKLHRALEHHLIDGSPMPQFCSEETSFGKKFRFTQESFGDRTELSVLELAPILYNGADNADITRSTGPVPGLGSCFC